MFNDTGRASRLRSGGVWQGVNRSTGCVASTVWVNRPSPAATIVFITIDGESVALAIPATLEPNPHTENRGES